VTPHCPCRHSSSLLSPTNPLSPSIPALAQQSYSLFTSFVDVRNCAAIGSETPAEAYTRLSAHIVLAVSSNHLQLCSAAQTYLRTPYRFTRQPRCQTVVHSHFLRLRMGIITMSMCQPACAPCDVRCHDHRPSSRLHGQLLRAVLMLDHHHHHLLIVGRSRSTLPSHHKTLPHNPCMASHL